MQLQAHRIVSCLGRQVYHEESHTKTGQDVSQMPSIQENLHHTRHSPEARGHVEGK